MAGRGRQVVLDQSRRDLLVGLVSLGCTFKQAAEHAGVGRSTLFKTLKEDPEWAERMRRAQMQQHVTPLSRMVEHTKGSWRACAWTLERLNPDRYGRRPPRTVTQADCLWITKLVLHCVLEGVRGEEDRQRVVRNVERLHRQLDGAHEASPRVRRALRDVQAAFQAWQHLPAEPSPDGPAASPAAAARPGSPEDRADAANPPAFIEGSGI
jgi:hypothetical protein